MKRVLSGVQPTGDVHLGNYLGAFRGWVQEQSNCEALYCIVDLHALTVDYDPKELAERTLDMATYLIACGLDPQRCSIFVQSQVPQHTYLAWILECNASMGELSRMTQFKDKGKGNDSVKVGLFTYPVLMAADILIYNADLVPVGDDQRQHLELARNIAMRFNSKYGTTFTVPQAQVPPLGARVMDLQDPTKKMSKSSSSPQGIILLSDDPATIDKKIKRAVTDNDSLVNYDPEHKPGISNLLELFSSASGQSIEQIQQNYTSYGPLKSDTAQAVIEMIAPIQERYNELVKDRKSVLDCLASGAEHATSIAGATIDQVASAIGLIRPDYI